MRSGLTIVGGVVLALRCVAHAVFGWAAVGGALRTAGTPPELMTDVASVWFLGTTAIGVFRTVALAYGVRLRRGDRSGLLALRIVGTAYLLYGATAFVLTGFNPHFLLMFVLPGALLAGSTIGA